MLLTAMQYYGLREIPGADHNPKILEFFSEIGHNWVQNDETAWCSAFINYVAKISHCEYSGELNARSWLSAGQKVTTPKHGDVVIFWRESEISWKGHVGLYAGQTPDEILCLGGNQGNEVNIKPYDKSRVIQYRRLNFLTP